MAKKTKRQWIDLGKKRIINILDKSRVSYKRHLEIKISEAGPTPQRVQPILLSESLNELLAEGKVSIVEEFRQHQIIGSFDYGRAGDHSRLEGFKQWITLFNNCSAQDHLCGLVFEKLLFNAAIDSNRYHVMGMSPVYNASNQLHKPSGSEVIYYNGNKVYKGDSGSGLDLFMIHRDSSIPIGIEAKNIREWNYPSSLNIWRLIARACTLKCLPVFAARKIAYITMAGLFKNCGILGFQTHSQFFHPGVRAFSGYEFKDKVIGTDKLGFHDIQIIKDTAILDAFATFFNDTLPKQVEPYYEQFLSKIDLLKKYAIDLQMAENVHNGYNRTRLYEEFKQEAEFDDPQDFGIIL